MIETRRGRRKARQEEDRRSYGRPGSGKTTGSETKGAPAGGAAEPLESIESIGPVDTPSHAESPTDKLPVAAASEPPTPIAGPSASAPDQPSASGASSRVPDSRRAEVDSVAEVWRPPRRRGLFRRRQKEDDLLSPVFRRRTEEPKLVVRLEKPRVLEDEAGPSEPTIPAPASPAETSEASRTAGASETQPQPVPPVEKGPAATAAEAPRIIHLVDAEDEDQAQQQAPAWVQRVVETPQPQVAPVAPEPEEAQETQPVPVAAAPADEEAGPLAHALSRASKTNLEGPRPGRSTPQTPPGALPDPLPFIRGIGRTRARTEPPPSPLPPVVHIQTIYLDEQGEPVIVTEEETAAAERRETAKREAAGRQAEAAEREAAEREAVLRAATEVEFPAEVLDVEPPAVPEPPAISEPPAPALSETREDATASWKVEPPVDAPWAEVAAPPAAEPPAVLDDERSKPTEFPAPAATSTRSTSSPAAEGPGAGDASPRAAAPAEVTPPTEPPAPAPRRVSRPAAIGPRPDRKASTGPDSDRPRPKSPTGGPRREAPEDAPAANVIPLSTGTAVRPHVTVNLTEEDIQDSDELYEVKALLHAITRDPQKKRAPGQPSGSRGSRPEHPAPDQRESRPGTEPRVAPGPVARPRTPEAREAGDRPAARKPGASERPGVAKDPQSRPTPAQSRPTSSAQQSGLNRPAVGYDHPGTRPPVPQDRPAAQPERQARPAGLPASKPPAAKELQPGVSILGATALPRRPNPWSEASRTQGQTEPKRDSRPPSSAEAGSNSVHPSEPRREAADSRPAEPPSPPKPAGARRKAARPVTLIRVDEEGRPQLD